MPTPSKQIKVKATFIGTDSLGYQNGKTYELLIFGSTIKSRHCGACEYESLESFFKNWKIV